MGYKDNDEPVVVPYEERFKSTGEGGASSFRFPDIDDLVWIPNSHIEEDDEARKEITIPTWVAEDKGLV